MKEVSPSREPHEGPIAEFQRGRIGLDLCSADDREKEIGKQGLWMLSSAVFVVIDKSEEESIGRRDQCSVGNSLCTYFIHGGMSYSSTVNLKSPQCCVL